MDGTWRSAEADREHRCTGSVPPQALPILTQKRLCLTPEHTSCGIYEAAVARRLDELGRDHVPVELVAEARFHAAAPAVPLIIDRLGPREPHVRSLPLSTAAGAAVVALLLVLTFVLMAFVPRSPGPPAAAVAATSPPASATPVPPPLPTEQVTQAPTPDTSATADPTRIPTAIASAATTRTYRVRSGDTLRRIADRFDTTASILRELNDLPRRATIRVGQSLIVPGP